MGTDIIGGTDIKGGDRLTQNTMDSEFKKKLAIQLALRQLLNRLQCIGLGKSPRRKNELVSDEEKEKVGSRIRRRLSAN